MKLQIDLNADMGEGAATTGSCLRWLLPPASPADFTQAIQSPFAIRFALRVSMGSL